MDGGWVDEMISYVTYTMTMGGAMVDLKSHEDIYERWV